MTQRNSSHLMALAVCSSPAFGFPSFTRIILYMLSMAPAAGSVVLCFDQY